MALDIALRGAQEVGARTRLIDEVWKVFDEAGKARDEQLRERLMEVGRQVARFSYLHSSQRAQDFLRAWEGAPVNPGASQQER